MRGFIGIDIETTGLEPADGHILEIGIVLFDEHLVPMERALVVGPDPEGVRLAHARKLDPYVRNMHRESGLLDDLDRISLEGRRKVPLTDVVDALSDWSERLGGKQPMLGSSVHFDRAWLKYHFPEVEECFSHRNIDASSMREYAKVVDPDKYADLEAIFTQRATHRAVDDVMASAELVKVLASHPWVAR